MSPSIPNAFSKVETAYRFPWTAVRRAKYKITRPFLSAPSNRIQFMDEDWDNLIILDACRFDLFEDVSNLSGDLKAVNSNATHTYEFVSKNLDTEHPDTVYITASPQLARVGENFAHIEHLWKTDWDEESKTVLPSTVVERTLELEELYNDKRLVVHFMQPHYPFIGPAGDELGEYSSFTGGLENKKHAPIWDKLASGDVSVEAVWNAYRENLELVLPHVETLVDQLYGKSVVTSDHGNLFRKRVSWLPIRIESHPRNFPDPDLMRVPWLVLPYDRRRTIETGDVTRLDSKDEDVVEDRLNDLGYL